MHDTTRPSNSPMDLPPMQQWARTFMNSPSAMMFFSVWLASSRVGDITSACGLLVRTKQDVVIRCQLITRAVAVLINPD